MHKNIQINKKLTNKPSKKKKNNKKTTTTTTNKKNNQPSITFVTFG